MTTDLERLALPALVAVFNHKGGVAKTTTASNVAAVLAALGYHVALIDLDAQGNATAGLGILPLPPAGAYDVLLGRQDLDGLLLTTPYPGLTLLPATTDLRMAELELAASDGSHLMLKTALQRHGLARYCQIAVIDCPPSLGMVTGNALSAARAVLIPARPDPYSHEGLVNTWHEIRRLRETVNPDLSVAGIVLTMIGADPTEADVARTIRAEFGDNVYAGGIDNDPKVVEAAQLGVPVVVLDPDGGAGRAYVDTALQLVQRLRRKDESLPEPAGLDAALNTLRDWRAAMPALQRLPTENEAWTAVTRANPGAEPADDWLPDEAPPRLRIQRRYTKPWLVGAFALGLVAGGVLGWFLGH